jgi:hypothetical protein
MATFNVTFIQLMELNFQLISVTKVVIKNYIDISSLPAVNYFLVIDSNKKLYKTYFQKRKILQN